MAMKIKTIIDLTVYGWEGWHIGPHGKSNQWRLFSPWGESFLPGELKGIHAAAMDNDYLKTRISCLTRALDHPAVSGRLDSAKLLAAVLGGLTGILSEPAALIGEPINRGTRSIGRVGLHEQQKALLHQVIQELGPLDVADVPERSDG